MERKVKNMEAIFFPRTVALVGASDNSKKLGFDVLNSLKNGEYKGKIFPINPRKREIMGLKAYPSLRQTPEAIDLAVIVVPASMVLEVIRECVEVKVRGVVLISGGFKEIENDLGAQLQSEIANLADGAGIPVIGPNTFGILNRKIGLNASFSLELSGVKGGNVGLLTQSGGMAHIITYLSMSSNLGLGKIMGLGNRCNIDFPQAISYLMEDADTKVIGVYLEGIDNPRLLIDVAKKHRGRKPIVIYKSGQSKRSEKAALSHTGSLAGRHEIYVGGFCQAGMLWVDSTEELIDTLKVLNFLPLPQDGTAVIVSGQGGPAITSSDVCEKMGLTLAPFNPSTQDMINGVLPPLTMRSNPLDLGPSWNNVESLKSILRIVLEDRYISAVLLIIVYGPANRHFIRELSGLLMEWKTRKPVVSCFSYPSEKWAKDIEDLEDACALVNYPTPERAARAISNLWKYQKIKMGVLSH